MTLVTGGYMHVLLEDVMAGSAFDMRGGGFNSLAHICQRCEDSGVMLHKSSEGMAEGVSRERWAIRVDMTLLLYTPQGQTGHGRVAQQKTAP